MVSLMMHIPKILHIIFFYTDSNMYVMYFLRLILSFTNTDVSRHILGLDTFVFAKDNIGRRE
jgi:hypothetical protein